MSDKEISYDAEDTQYQGKVPPRFVFVQHTVNRSETLLTAYIMWKFLEINHKDSEF